jgi:hypothetical protein
MLLGIFAHISRYPHQRPDTVTKQRDIPAKSLEKQQKIERNAPQIQRPVYADVVIEREYYTVYLSYSLKHGMTVQSANEQEDIEIYSEGEYETFLAIDTTSPEQDEISSQVHQEPAHHQTAPDQTYISAVLPDAISLQPNEYSDPAIIVQLDSQPPSAVTPILLSGNQTTNIEL